MKKPYRYSEHIRTLKKSGSLLFCNSCNKIIGSINEKSYSALQIATICSCYSVGFLQYSDKMLLPRKKSGLMPGYVNGVYTCNKCRTPLFSIIAERVKNYSFYVECKCGEIYDTRVNHDKRILETIELYKALNT